MNTSLKTPTTRVKDITRSSALLFTIGERGTQESALVFTTAKTSTKPSAYLFTAVKGFAKVSVFPYTAGAYIFNDFSTYFPK